MTLHGNIINIDCDHAHSCSTSALSVLPVSMGWDRKRNTWRRHSETLCPQTPQHGDCQNLLYAFLLSGLHSTWDVPDAGAFCWARMC